MGAVNLYLIDPLAPRGSSQGPEESYTSAQPHGSISRHHVTMYVFKMEMLLTQFVCIDIELML